MVIKQTLNDLTDDCIHIWQIDLDGPVASLAELLSAEELKRAEAKLQTNAPHRSIRARGAIRSILGDYLAVPGAKLEFVQGEQGKPSIFLPNSDIEFNLTHCENIALLAVANKTPVGIDLERIRTRPFQLKIAQRMFSEQVFRELSRLSSDQLDTAFFQHWTELEACAKCIGYGIFSYKERNNKISTKHFTPKQGWISCIATESADVSSMQLKHFVYRN
jgi:4'-phosphopantetheinyl transferase